jgi:pimeloyl-ACP methyl ester carboxylesterase
MVQRTGDDNASLADRTVLFLQGFGLKPSFYRRFLERLLPDGVRLVAPFIFCNNGLADPPTTFEQCIDWARRAADEVDAESMVVIGHSTGAMAAMHGLWADPRVQRMVLMNQVMPVDYGAGQFISRGNRILANQLRGRAGPRGRAWWHVVSTVPVYTLNFLRKYRRSMELMRALAAYDLPEPADSHPDMPGRVHILNTGTDEFFDYTRPWPAWVTAAEPVIEQVPLAGHEWPLIEIERGADLVRRHLPADWLT